MLDSYTPFCLCLLHFIVFQTDIYVKMHKAQFSNFDFDFVFLVLLYGRFKRGRGGGEDEKVDY